MLKHLLSLPLIAALIFSPAICTSQQHAVKSAKSGNEAASVNDRIRRVETGIPPIPTPDKAAPLQLDIPKLMEVFKVPGLSVAVIDNYKIAWAKAYGVTAIGGSTPVTTKTLFQAGSISKPVAATGALYLVEHGKLSLDEDVNKKLVTWKVPENEFTKDQKVTLRRLMTHSAGLTVHGFPGYATDAPVPTLVQIFNGEKPANTAPIRVDFVPGSKVRYSGGGVTIEQQLMIDVTGTPFPQFMKKNVLAKIGMTDSSYEQPLPAARAALTATGTYSDGKAVPGKWHIYPEMAAAGLWTTPTDLAKFVIEIALSKQGKSNHVLSQAMASEMLRPQIERVGLGFFLGDEKTPDQFGHGGADEGFQADVIMFGDSGQGIAIMGNSDNFFAVASYFENSVAKEYGWKLPPREHPTGQLLALVQRMQGTQVAIEEFQYLKQAHLPDYKVDEDSLNTLGYVLLQSKKIDDAIQVFKLNVQEYPKHWNCYDSLGEAYLNAGQKELAIQNYQKSVELNPENTNGIEALKKLKGE
ncbi:MAG TPA: serine hydrolase [Candidatus Angelobacter sp.]